MWLASTVRRGLHWVFGHKESVLSALHEKQHGIKVNSKHRSGGGREVSELSSRMQQRLTHFQIHPNWLWSDRAVNPSVGV